MVEHPKQGQHPKQLYTLDRISLVPRTVLLRSPVITRSIRCRARKVLWVPPVVLAGLSSAVSLFSNMGRLADQARGVVSPG